MGYDFMVTRAGTLRILVTDYNTGEKLSTGYPIKAGTKVCYEIFVEDGQIQER